MPNTNFGSDALSHPARERYAQLRADGKKQTVASKACGFSLTAVKRWEKRADVKARIAFLVGETSEKPKQLRLIDINRNDIIMGLADVAREGKSERARVAAWSTLADIFMLKPKSLKELQEFYGWSVEEIQYFSETGGKIPPRLKPLLGDGGTTTNDVDER
jgi:hypothetical protein